MEDKNKDHIVRNKKLHGVGAVRIVLYWLGAIISIVALAAFWLSSTDKAPTNSSESASVSDYCITMEC